MRLNWFSNAPWAATGYGNQTRVFAPRLAALGHDLSISAFYGLQGSPIQWNGITVFPLARHPYGQDIMNAHAINARAEAILSLLDIWVVKPEYLTVPWYPRTHTRPRTGGGKAGDQRHYHVEVRAETG